MPTIKYRFHFPGGDWQPWMESGQIAGTLGESRPVDLIQVDAEGVGVAVQVHTEGFGWLEPVGGMETAGVEGHQIEAIRIGLTGANSESYEVSYRSHVQDLGWLNWTRNAQTSGTEGRSLRLEAFQAYLGKKGELFFDVNRTETSFGPEPQPVTEVPQTPGEPESSKRRRVCDIALNYVGYQAGSGNYSVFGERWGDPYGEWCAYFVRSVFDDAGLGELVPPTGYCPYATDWFLNHETASLYRGYSDYIPQPGDVIYFDYNLNDSPDHTGIVIGCDGEYITTVEGNTGGEPTQVKHKVACYAVGESDIYGYGVPDYRS